MTKIKNEAPFELLVSSIPNLYELDSLSLWDTRGGMKFFKKIQQLFEHMFSNDRTIGGAAKKSDINALDTSYLVDPYNHDYISTAPQFVKLSTTTPEGSETCLIKRKNPADELGRQDTGPESCAVFLFEGFKDTQSYLRGEEIFIQRSNPFVSSMLREIDFNPGNVPSGFDTTNEAVLSHSTHNLNPH